MISILITAWKEEKTIGKCIETIINGINSKYEILLACPDNETLNVAKSKLTELGHIDKLIHIKDPGLGKPYALKMLMDKANGNIWILGDGDSFFGENVVELLVKHFNKSNVHAVTGRPISIDTKNTMLGYFGHLLTDAAHHKRTIDLTQYSEGFSKNFIKKRPFFPVSGYLFAMRKTDVRAPKDCLVEDAYLSYVIHNQGNEIAYEPNAKVFVKFPSNLSDYFKQKKRSVGGFIQLWKYGVVKNETKTRSFWRELEYFWFPIKYAENFKELVWSICLYPIRLYLWIIIYWERKFNEKSFEKTWVRIESTK